MIYKPFHDRSLSRLGMGNMRLPTEGDKADAPIDYARAQQIIDRAMAQGINYYDTAYRYHSGGSEPFLGKALAAYDRGSYCLATKFSYDANPDYKAVFAEQREKLRTDYLDFYLLHAVGEGNFENYLSCGCIDYFLEQKAQGKIRHLGFSSHAGIDTLNKMLDRGVWDFIQIQLNYFDWLFGTAKAEYEAITARGLPVMVMESVRGGRLSQLSPEAEGMLRAAHPDWSISSWAFRWLQRLPGVQVCLSGMSNLDQLQDNLNTFSVEQPLTDDEEKLLFEAAAAFRREVSVPCTGCRYCCDGCPAEINIPAVLEIYNRYKLDGIWALQRLKNLDSAGKPADCVACGACRNICPQGIEIPKLMAELTEAQKKLD